MSQLVLLASLIVVCNSAAINEPPNLSDNNVNIVQTIESELEESADQKVIVAPYNNCSPGQDFINGRCRDVWRNEWESKSAVSVPNNCLPPRQFINGQCREVWILDPNNVVVAPNNCPPGQQFINGRCRDVWSHQLPNEPFNVVTVPPNCPDGQEYINGECRDVWQYLLNELYNVVSVPPNCPTGQQFINGQCRDVWIKQNGVPFEPLDIKTLAVMRNSVKRIARQANEETDDAEANEKKLPPTDINRNIISVPNQCPTGSKPDALGICRPTFD